MLTGDRLQETGFRGGEHSRHERRARRSVQGGPSRSDQNAVHHTIYVDRGLSCFLHKECLGEVMDPVARSWLDGMFRDLHLC